MQKKSLVVKIFIAFLIGLAVGIGLFFSKVDTSAYIKFVGPFGDLLVAMLKMIVVPVILLSLIDGAASIQLREFGKIGLKIIAWYFVTSFFAAIWGSGIAILFNPGGGAANKEAWEKLINIEATQGILEKSNNSLADVLLSMFQNPFQALSSGNFLAIIVFSIAFGLALRIVQESENPYSSKVGMFIDIVGVAKEAIFKMVDWILAYSPIGVFALTSVNFAKYGSTLFGPYVSLTIGIVIGILTMIFIVYPLLMGVILRINPLVVMMKLREPMLTSFVTRSSAATLPVSLRVAKEELKIDENISSFALPLGATINMDGVCIHLPMFAVLASNMFGIELGVLPLSLLVITTVLASVGAGGVPGGSLMLLFIILQNMGMDPEQIAIIVGLALGINPILDMFETMNNVTGDLVCTYSVARLSGLVKEK